MVENVIGSGGFGTVYAGKRKADGKLVSCYSILDSSYTRISIILFCNINSFICFLN